MNIHQMTQDYDEALADLDMFKGIQIAAAISGQTGLMNTARRNVSALQHRIAYLDARLFGEAA